MGEWLLLPTELWCLVIGNIQCVFDRAELSLTCTRLHEVVPGVKTPPASLPAFRSYHDKLTRLDQHLMSEKNVTRSKRRRIDPLKTLSLDALVSMKEHVTRDLEEGDGYEPHFLELVLKWIEVTKPTTRVVEMVWETVAFGESYSFSMFSYKLALDFKKIVETSSIGIHLQPPERSWPVEWRFSKNAIYKTKAYLAEIDLPIAVFKRVNNIGHCVFDLPRVKSKYRRCTEYNIVEHDSLWFCTLTIESGYYVVRHSTLKELHGQSIQDCQNYSEACFFERSLIMMSPDYKVLPAKLDTSQHNLPPPHNRSISLLYNTKTVIDDVLCKMTSAQGNKEVTMLVIVEPYEL